MIPGRGRIGHSMSNQASKCQSSLAVPGPPVTTNSDCLHAELLQATMLRNGLLGEDEGSRENNHEYLNHPQIKNLIEQVFKIQMGTIFSFLINFNQVIAFVLKEQLQHHDNTEYCHKNLEVWFCPKKRIDNATFSQVTSIYQRQFCAFYLCRDTAFVSGTHPDFGVQIVVSQQLLFSSTQYPAA